MGTVKVIETVPTVLAGPVLSSLRLGYHSAATVSLMPKPTPIMVATEPALPWVGDRTMAGFTVKGALAILPLVCPTAMTVCGPAFASGTVIWATKEPVARVVAVVSGVVVVVSQKTLTASPVPKVVPVMVMVWKGLPLVGPTTMAGAGTGVLVGVCVGGTGVLVGVEDATVPSTAPLAQALVPRGIPR